MSATLGKVIAGVVGCLIVAAVITVTQKISRDNGLQRICKTKECRAEAALVLKRMNRTANPCGDFYEFACGTFLKETVIPDDKTSVSMFEIIGNKLKDELRVIAEESIRDGEIEPFKNVKRLYKACMNTALIEKLGVTPVLNLINKMGGWPVLEAAWNDSNWTWQKSAQLALENGYSVGNFIDFSVSTDPNNSSRRVVQIDQANLGLNREFLIRNLSEPFVKAYHDYQVDLAILFGANRSRAKVEMMEALDFEIKLAQISLAPKDRRDIEKLYNRMSIRDLRTNATFAYERHDWLAYLNNLLPPESQLTEDTVVVVAAISFFQQLGSLLKNSQNRIMANYAAWRNVLSSVEFLPKNFRARQLEFQKITIGRINAKPRWQECVESTLSALNLAFGALYVRKHFNEAAKRSALEMVKNLKDEFKIMLSEITWMDQHTKKGANEKVINIREEIGFADQLLDDQVLSSYYAAAPAEVNDNEYLKSQVNVARAAVLRIYRRLYEPVNKTEWSSHVPPAIVNAYYSPLQNKIAFPAAILQGTFFNYARPQYMNYGGIGYVIGHEITHGFDDQGSQFDAQGNLKNWWEKATHVAYLEKSQCMVKQYSDFVEPMTGLKVNGDNTLGENIADNGGIKEAYRAYRRWAKRNPEPRMPGLDYTPQQMFWISAGQVWCSLERKARMKNLITTGTHSPGRFRVVGPLRNMKEFSYDFNCAVGTPMNPANKCVVW